jgi:hypothetical protein
LAACATSARAEKFGCGSKAMNYNEFYATPAGKDARKIVDVILNTK